MKPRLLPISSLVPLLPLLPLVLVAVVLLLHWVALSWVADQIRSPAPLAQLAQPMFTRIVEPTPAPELVLASPTTPPSAAKPKQQQKAITVAAPTPAVIELADEGSAVASPTAPASTPATESPSPITEPGQPAVAANPLPAAEPMAPQDTWPPDTRLSYRLSGNYRGELSGSARVQWQQVPGPDGTPESRRYQVRLEMSLSSLVIASMTSQGKITEAGLLPQVYEERLPGAVRRVDFEDTRIRFNNGRVDVRPTSVQDTASQFVELSHRFATGLESLKAGAEVRLWLARPGGLDFWTYDVIGPEVLQTHGLGAVETFLLKPRPLANPRGPIAAEMWFAPSLQYLPVRVRIALGGNDFVDLMIERIEQADPTPAVEPQSSAPELT